MGTRLGLKKRGKGYLLAALVVLLPTLGLPPEANALLLTIDDIIVQHVEDGNLVNTDVLSGTADATFAAGTLTIILTNTSTESTGFAGATNILTGIAFNLPSGVSISGGSVSMLGETAINFAFPAGGDISSQWGFDNNPITGPFVNPDLTDAIVNTSVATMASSATNHFASGASSLDGPSYGLLSGAVPASTAGGLSAIQNSIVITLNLDGSFGGDLIAFMNTGDVVLSFGSPDVAVAEPASLVLLGSGLITLGFFGRRKLFSSNKNKN